MEKMYNYLTVRAAQINRVEELMNELRIGLNDWSRTGALNYAGIDWVTYTIICTSAQMDTIRVIIGP